MNTKNAEKDYKLARMLEGTGKPIGIMFGMFVYCDNELKEGEAYLFDKNKAYIL